MEKRDGFDKQGRVEIRYPVLEFAKTDSYLIGDLGIGNDIKAFGTFDKERERPVITLVIFIIGFSLVRVEIRDVFPGDVAHLVPEQPVPDMPAYQFLVLNQFRDIFEDVPVNSLEDILDILVYFHQIGVVDMARAVWCCGDKIPA